MDEEFVINELIKRGIIRQEDVPTLLEEKLENEDIFVTLVRMGILSEKQSIHLFKELANRQTALTSVSEREEASEEDIDFFVEGGIIRYFTGNSYYIIPISRINFLEVKDSNILILHFSGIDRLTIKFSNKQDLNFAVDKIRQYMEEE